MPLTNLLLITLTKDLTDLLRKNLTIDWQKKESARAMMRKLVKHSAKAAQIPTRGHGRCGADRYGAMRNVDGQSQVEYRKVQLEYEVLFWYNKLVNRLQFKRAGCKVLSLPITI